jgi:hypothetical protein
MAAGKTRWARFTCFGTSPLLILGLVVCLASTASTASAEEAAKGLFYPSRLTTAAGGYLDPTQFSPARVCAGCHPDIFYQWSGSMHSNAHPDPLYRALSEKAGAETAGLTDRFCAGCHSPIAVASGEVPPRGNPEMSRTGAEGVSCDFCHVIDRAEGTGNLPAVLDPGAVKRGPRREARSPFHETRFLDLATQAEYCGLCHDVHHPLNDVPIEHTYTEWKEGPYNTADPATRVYCQDCHMRQRPGVASTGATTRPNNRGKAATMGPWRDNVYTHWFVGANRSMTGRFGAGTHRDMAGERLRGAATLEIVGSGASGGNVTCTVRVINSGAGHFLPTGLTELREMWVETTITDADGRVIHRAGAPDAAGSIDSSPAVFRTVLGDSAGKPTAKVWEAAAVLSDRRIPPRGHEDVSVSAPFDRKAKSPLTVRVRLMYRSFPPVFARELLGPEAPIDEPFEMTAAQAAVEIPR